MSRFPEIREENAVHILFYHEVDRGLGRFFGAGPWGQQDGEKGQQSKNSAPLGGSICTWYTLPSHWRQCKPGASALLLGAGSCLWRPVKPAQQR